MIIVNGMELVENGGVIIFSGQSLIRYAKSELTRLKIFGKTRAYWYRYPALKRLMKLKDELVDETSHSPLYLHLLEDTGGPALPTPRTIQNAVTTNRFDSILITPPQPLDWSYISSLPIRNISADPGFVFLWCGAASSEGLEKGRECFAKWGFRRAEDIVWVKTNKGKDFVKSGDGRDEGGLFAGQKEHCLMGIRGTVRRSTDSRFVHCNVDTDVMVWENEPGELLVTFV